MTRSVLTRGALVAAGAGLYGLAMPPVDRPELAWLTLVPLLVAIRGCTLRVALGLGALWGLVASWAVTWWLVPAVAHYFRIGIAPAAAAMSVAYVLALSCTAGPFAAAAAWFLRRTSPPVATLAIPALWVVAELVRARGLSDPWALLGYTQHANVGLIQVAAVTGVYGVSFIVALGNAALAEAIARMWAGRPFADAARVLGAPATVIASLWLVGAAALPPPSTEPELHPVAVVQTNVPPAYEWTRGYAERQLAEHLGATARLLRDIHPALVVWPENALTLYYEHEPMVARQLRTVARSAAIDLLFGAPRHADGRTFNSARLVTRTGYDTATYDKQRLVPFAEMSPLASPVPAAAAETPEHFTAGTTAGVLPAFVPTGVSICHEILYPDVIEASVRAGAELLVNIANDGWLDGGTGFASRQHFAMAALRAVETRRYVVRAATTGISGVIDPYGRVLATQATATAGIVTASVAARGEMTPYVLAGDAFGLTCALAIPLLAAAGSRRRTSVPQLAPAPVAIAAR
ncbi:MAG: apolipoprotein N-acyltransferase [Candidatus Binatia bacterium]